MAINPIEIIGTRYGTVGLQYSNIPEVAPVKFEPGKHHIVKCKDIRAYIGLAKVQEAADQWTFKTIKASLIASLPAIATKLVLVGLATQGGPLAQASDTCITVSQAVPIGLLAPALGCAGAVAVSSYQAGKLSDERAQFLARGRRAGAPWTRLLNRTRELADFTQLETIEELSPLHGAGGPLGPDALGGAGPGPEIVPVVIRLETNETADTQNLLPRVS
jgi:cell division protein FtsL